MIIVIIRNDNGNDSDNSIILIVNDDTNDDNDIHIISNISTNEINDCDDKNNKNKNRYIKYIWRRWTVYQAGVMASLNHNLSGTLSRPAVYIQCCLREGPPFSQQPTEASHRACRRPAPNSWRTWALVPAVLEEKYSSELRFLSVFSSEENVLQTVVSGSELW